MNKNIKFFNATLEIHNKVKFIMVFLIIYY